MVHLQLESACRAPGSSATQEPRCFPVLQKDHGKARFGDIVYNGRMNPEELGENDGRDGKPAYVAYEGRVYDVSASKLWPDGNHMKIHQAGGNLTSHLPMAPHGPEVFERVKEVGALEAADDEGLDAEYDPQVKFRELYRKFHPHPIMIHFPIALFIFSAVLHVLYWVFSAPSLESASFYAFVFASLATPAAVASGFLSWWLNYDLSLTSVFGMKIAGSMLLLGISAIVLAMRLIAPEIATQGGPLSLLYGGLVVFTWPLVAFIGYQGGKIIFPA